MPYKDPEKQKAAQREYVRRRRAEEFDQAVVEPVGVGRVLVPPPSKEELLSLLGVQARRGSIRAMELLLKREDANGANDLSDPLAGFDDLAKRRAVGA